MLEQIKQFFELPSLDDEDAVHIMVPLSVLLLSLFIGGLVTLTWVVLSYGIRVTLSEWPLTAMSSLFLILMVPALWSLMRRGHVFFVGVALTALFWSLLTFWMYATIGIRELSAGGYLLVMLIAGLVAGARGVVLVGVLSLLAVVGAYIAEVQGWIVVPLLNPIHPFHLISAIALLAMGMLLIRYTVLSVERAFARVRRQERALAESYRRSEAHRRELEAQNAELDAFAHTVAHDLKNPLAGMVMVSGLLERYDSSLTNEQRINYVQMLGQGLGKMQAIIDELLLLSSVRQREQVPLTPLDMAEIVSEAQKRLVYMFAGLQADANITLPDQWPVALGYAPWVEEVWVNYLSNAVKYGGRPLRIKLGATLVPASPGAEQDMVRFWIWNNGVCLTPEQQACLFVPFERLHDASTEGEGLGLSIVQRIVHKLGGEVGVESAEGEGCTFFFTLQHKA
jgi:signal transduction histidine kinase